MADTEEQAGGAPAAPGKQAKGLWAPTRGYFEVAGGKAGGAPRAAAGKKLAPKKDAGEGTAAAAAGAQTAAPAAPAAGATAAARPSKEAAAPGKAAAKPPKEAVAPAKADPARDSITTVPGLAESALGKTLVGQFYDAPDSETTLYKVPAMNVLFAITSALLLAATLLVVGQDYSRPWKRIQADWNGTLAKRYEKDLGDERAKQSKVLADLEPGLAGIIERLLGAVAAPGAIRDAHSAGPSGSPARADALLAAARKTLEKNPSYARYKELRAEAEKAHTTFTLREKTLRAFRGDFQAAKFRLDEAKRHAIDEKGDTQESAREIQALEERFAADYLLERERREDDVEKLEVRSREANAALAQFEKHATLVTPGEGPLKEVSLPALAGHLEEISREVKDAHTKVESVEETWRSFVRNMPLFDFLAPTYKIEKVVLKDLHEDLNFETVPRVERCKTCHLNVDNPDPVVVDVLSKDWGTVYRSHPRLDLFVGSASPHPYEKFGCTPCHQGDGHATDFITASHTPEDELEAARWEKKYHWEPLHHQDFPMFEKKYLTASCMKCHPADHNLEGGGSYNLGYEVVKTYGCYGCHNIPIFKGFDKVGPNLTHIAEKADLAWIYRWVRNPTHFRPSTRMPRFFDLTNSRGVMLVQDGYGPEAKTSELDFDVRNGIEALSIATYLSGTSDRRADLKKLDAKGDPARGRDLFLMSGCLGCHSVKRESMAGEKGGEDLAAIVNAAVTGLDGAIPKESAKPGLAETARAAGSALAALHRFYETLAVGQNAEALYHDVVTVLDDLVKLDEALGADGGPVAAAHAAGRAIYDRWIHNTQAPDLSSIGSKVRSPEWLADWIVDPRKHDPETIMPKLRLEKGEGGEQSVADMVAYLLTLRDGDFERSPIFSVSTPEAAKALDDIALDYKRRLAPRAEAKKAIEGLSTEEKLRFVGHRLIRRYGCFGCHNGITDVDATKEVEKDGEKQVVRGTFDAAQPIGTDLTGWGWKMPAFLDYGNWGHQHSGRDAIGHTRYDWARAKLMDTRRFDVIPSEKRVAEGKYEYLPTNRLIQKTPEELLKMGRFGFAADPRQVEAVVTFLGGLGKDRIPLEKTRVLGGKEKTLEDGARLIAKLNCQGCHRIGAETQHVHVSDLPLFSLFATSDEDVRRSELEKETWLARDVRLVAYDPEEKGADRARAGVLLRKGTLLGRQVFDTTTMAHDKETMEPTDDEPLSVIELAAGPADPDSKVPGHFKALKVPLSARTLPVAGFEEGRIRFYFGGGDPRGGADGRPMAPPALVRQGERVLSDWLFHFLLDVYEIRPWLKVRMPSFYLTPDEARLLVAWFKANAGVPEANELFQEATLRPELAAKGRELFGPTVGERVGLQCNSCHPAGESLPTLPVLNPPGKLDYKRFGFDVPDDKFYVVWEEAGAFMGQLGFADAAAAESWAKENLAGKPYAVGDPWSKISWGPDLGKAATRLRPTWIRDWVSEPKDFMPGTKMTNYFGERDPIRGLHYRDPRDKEAAARVETNIQKIESLVQYLVHMKAFDGVAKAAGDDD